MKARTKEVMCIRFCGFPPKIDLVGEKKSKIGLEPEPSGAELVALVTRRAEDSLG